MWVNCWFKRDLRTPFGGMKASGVGREGGLDVAAICEGYGGGGHRQAAGFRVTREHELARA